MRNKTNGSSTFLFPLWLATLFIALQTSAGIKQQLSFSVDGGKTFSDDYPTVKVGGSLICKVKYSVDEDREIKNNVITTSLYCVERDFASANVGKKSWNGFTAWYQRLAKYWASPRKPGVFMYRIDLGARRSGVMGRGNKWDGKQHKFVDAPLPAVSALPPGQYKFTISLNYRIKADNSLVKSERTFYVTVSDKDIQPPARKRTEKESKRSGAAVSVRKKVGKLPKISGDYVFEIADGWFMDENGKKTKTSAKLAKANNKDFHWRISNVAPGDYHVRLLVESGRRSGEEELSKARPFLYINGGAIHFKRATGPREYKNIFVSVIESEKPVAVKNGDVIRWNRRRRSFFGALSLAKRKLSVAPIWVRPFFDPYLDDRFRISGKFEKNGGSRRGLSFAFAARNVTGHEAEITVECEIRDYFQNVLARFSKKMKLRDWERFSGSMPVPSAPTDRYLAELSVIDANGWKRAIARTLLVDDFQSKRKKTWLNDDWEWTSIADDGTLATRVIQPPESAIGVGGWKKVDLPAGWQDSFKNKNHHLAWYRKSFRVDPKFKNDRYLLHFARVSCEGKIYLNGNLAAFRKNPNGPFDIDVTKYLKIGEPNTLLIGLRDKTASLAPSELSKKVLNPTRACVLKAPLGMRPGLGEVSLISTCEKAIEDVFVKTSFAKKTISLAIQTPKRLSGNGYSLRNSVYLRGRKIFELPDTPIERRVAIISKPWESPPLWGPTKFPLLKLSTELLAPNGKVLDVLETRFGFREFTSRGMDLVWNGKKVKFASRPFLSSWSWNIGKSDKRDAIRASIRMAKRMGCDMLRHIYSSENFAEIADEEGMVIAQGGANTIAEHTKQQIDSDEFWRNVFEFAKAMVLGLRNHPAIVEWYLSNEYMGESEKSVRDRLTAYGKKVLKIDDSRIIEFGCDIDLKGFNSVISTHYPVDVRAFRDPAAFLPEATYWRYFRENFHPGMKVPAGMCARVANVHGESPITWGYKPIIVNETCWIAFFHEPDGLSRIFSDRVYESPWAVDYAHGLANAMFARGHRDADVSAITLWRHISVSPNWLSLPRIDVNILQKYNKFYSGEKVSYDVNLTHDVMRSEKLTFVWKLKDGGGGEILSGSRAVAFDNCELKREKISFTVPSVDVKTRFVLDAALTRDGKPLRTTSREILAYPNENSASLLSKILLMSRDARIPAPDAAVFDATGESLKSLSGILKNTKTVKVLNSNNLKDIKLLVIGKNQPVEILEKAKEVLDDFVEDGGKVLLLRQSKSQTWLPVKLTVSSRTPAVNYTFRPAHPLLRGVTIDELSYWYPEHKTGEGYYVKPVSGNFKVVVEAGGPNGMIYAGLLELPRGKGAFICSQLSLIENFSVNPIARKLWRNIIAYAAERQPEMASAGILDDSDALPDSLRVINVQTSKVDASNIHDVKVVIVGSLSKTPSDKMALLRKFAESGGIVLVEKASPEDKRRMEEISGAEIEFAPITAEAWKGRAVILANTPITAGLTNFDFFRRERPETENYAPSYFSPKTVKEELGKWEMLPKNGIRRLMHPSLLLSVPLGKGKIVLNAIGAGTSQSETSKLSKRVSSVLLTNLGVSIAGEKSLEIPPNLKYTPIDISKYLNRSFTDDKEDDGKGGWTDQGPNCDLRSFPADKNIFTCNNVPFKISTPKSCLVLKSKYRKGNAPSSVDLPVGMKADVLFFLQSSAWTSGKHHASYIVKYDDGTSYEIRLIGGVNLRDWAANNPDDAFPTEFDTITRRAWTGSSGKLGKGSLYMMAWPNPHPRKKIDAITFKSMNVGVPVLVAVTAGETRKTAEKPKSTPRQRALAEKLNALGEKSLKEHDAPRAEECFKNLKSS